MHQMQEHILLHCVKTTQTVPEKQLPVTLWKIFKKTRQCLKSGWCNCTVSLQQKLFSLMITGKENEMLMTNISNQWQRLCIQKHLISVDCKRPDWSQNMWITVTVQCKKKWAISFYSSLCITPVCTAENQVSVSPASIPVWKKSNDSVYRH